MKYCSRGAWAEDTASGSIEIAAKDAPHSIQYRNTEVFPQKKAVWVFFLLFIITFDQHFSICPTEQTPKLPRATS